LTENDGPSKSQDKNLRDIKFARHETAGREKAGHEILGQKNIEMHFCGYFLKTQHYYVLCINDYKYLLNNGNTVSTT